MIFVIPMNNPMLIKKPTLRMETIEPSIENKET
jgi:hypothetical protein